MTMMIGLEIHCQITRLQSKLFCSCSTDYRDMEANQNVCPTCMGLPGTLPRLNGGAVSKAMLIGMALNCTIPEKIAFFRKNYFYPDLPKNFQITQLNAYGDTCIGTTGHIGLDADHTIRITRVQLEEDPGRLVYEQGPSKTTIALVDYNRAGTPLVEIVTEPDFEDPSQVRKFLNILSDLLENLDVSDPGMEGAMRVDANVSIKGGSKVEIKNIGSFYDLEKAVRFEITRQQSLDSRGIAISQETRHWDNKRRVTLPSRSKEGDADYRYFLEGDIPWVYIDHSIRENLHSQMPESISSKRERYVSKYGITEQVAQVLSTDKFYSDLFEDACAVAPKMDTDDMQQLHAREMANIITTDLMGLADTRERRESLRVSADGLCDLASSIMSGEISRSSSKNALAEMLRTGKGLSDVMTSMSISKISDQQQLDDVVVEVISEEPKAVEQAKNNPQAVHYLVGMVMKKTKGRADPTVTLDLIRQKLQSQV